MAIWLEVRCERRGRYGLIAWRGRMQTEHENAINNTARVAIKEFTNPTNKLTYRQILDKHSTKIAPLIPAKHREVAWLWLNCVCQRLARGG